MQFPGPGMNEFDSASYALLSETLRDGRCGFSVGGLGALAEFHDGQGSFTPHSDGAMVVRSARGALRIRPAADINPLAYETLSGTEDSWQWGVVLLGADPVHAMGRRKVLTEIGPDGEAIKRSATTEVLFDLGAGLPHVDYCVRTADDALLALLRRYRGKAVIAERHEVMEAIIDASPTRVALSSVARIEVYQRIDRHQTPSGPHTHLLPDLLKHGRTHSANIPVPAGFYPVFTIHPRHPLYDDLGRRHRFDAQALSRFQPWLDAFGDRRYVSAKRKLENAVINGESPADYRGAQSRAGRLAERVALRQLGHTLSDPTTRNPWLDRFRA